MSTETFPGVYTTIKDESIQPTLSSRFRAGIVGVSTKGPMNVPTSVPTSKSMKRIFGSPVAGHEMGPVAIAVTAEYSDGNVFTRVGSQYESVAADGSSTYETGSGPSVPDQYKIYTAQARKFQIGDYIRVVQAGQKSTINARVEDYIPSGNSVNPTGLELVSAGLENVPLASEDYDGATIDRSTIPNAASNAEAFLYAINYGTANYTESAGFVSGDKSKFEFTTSGIVGPQPVDSMTVSSSVAEVDLGSITARFKVGDRIHIENAGLALANGEFEVTAVNYGANTIEFDVLSEYGPELLDGETVAGGYAQISVTPGAQYDWTKGVNETLLVNGSTSISASGTFVAAGNFVRVYSTSGTADGNLAMLQGLPDGAVPVASGATDITISILKAGDIIKVVQTARNTTWDAMVKEVINGETESTVRLYPSSLTDSGYQPVALQDNYSAGLIYKATKDEDGQINTSIAQHLIAASAGSWANSDGVSTGLWIKVAPGSAPGSKKFLIYERGSLVETIDNLSLDADSDNYYVTRINGVSENISILTNVSGDPDGMIITNAPPANTFKGWDSSKQKINFTVFGADGNGQGFNGELAEASDYVGTYNDSTDRYTGLRAFLEEGSNFDLSVIAVPGVTDYSVHQELLSIAEKINVLAVIDHPKGLNGRQIVDWSNGAGAYSSRGTLDSWHGALVWNWFNIASPFDGEDLWVSPTIGLLRQMAFTAENYKPWYAPSGETRGVINIAKSVEFPHVSKETRAAMYGGGQAVNPILNDFGKKLIYGNRTLQRVESKLSDLSVAILVKYTVKNMALIGRKYIFDPNDPELLMLLRLDMTSFLEGLKSDRGIEGYSLKIDSENNSAEVRNQRAAIVDFNIIPFGAMERLYINATVNSSGAVLNTVNTQ